MIPENEIRMETIGRNQRAREAANGGPCQVVGLDQGVKLTHIPTGITASCKAARSQVRNRRICLDMLEAALTNPLL